MKESYLIMLIRRRLDVKIQGKYPTEKSFRLSLRFYHTVLRYRPFESNVRPLQTAKY